QDLPGPARSPPPAKVLVGVAGALSLGSLPRVAPGAGITLEVAFPRRFALRADALYWFPVTVETPRGVGATFQAVSGTLALCPALGAEGRALAFFVCGGVQTTALFASPHELDGPRRTARAWPQGVLELTLRVRLGEE